jgi:hypothetical protein
VFGQESNTSEAPAPSTLRCAHYPTASCADPPDLRLVYLIDVPNVLTAHRRVAASSARRIDGLVSRYSKYTSVIDEGGCARAFRGCI